VFCFLCLQVHCDTELFYFLFYFILFIIYIYIYILLMNVQCGVIQRICVVDACIRNKSYEVFCRKCRSWFPGVSVPSTGEQISSNAFFVTVEVTVIPVCSFSRNTG
jgi:hypothetical protein